MLATVTLYAERLFLPRALKIFFWRALQIRRLAAKPAAGRIQFSWQQG
jgi:hypothetical protein